MKEIYFQVEALHPKLQSEFKDFILNKTQAVECGETDWVNGLLDEIDFTNEFHVSLFHEGFASGNSPSPPEDLLSVLFIKMQEAKIFSDDSDERYFHGFISSWDTTKEPSKFLMKGYTKDEINELINTGLLDHFSLISM